ncbi:MAG: hypothetical protein M1537_07050 [Nitrospirae bacterium]|nr:hypothetical protein [Nitrospirota bacterium]MCL5285874.1 hypothetical protein [Nitrospirota bacterium]
MEKNLLSNSGWFLGLGLLLILLAPPAGADPLPAPAPPAAQGGEWQSVATVALPGGATRFDYQSLDPETGRLYIAHLGESHLVVFDTKSRKVVADLPGFPNVHGVLAVPSLHRVYATVSSLSRRNPGFLAVVDSQTLKTVGMIPVGIHPDGLDYEPRTGRIFVSNEWGKSVSVVDAGKNAVIARIPLHGEVGNTRTDSVTHRIYATVQTENRLVRIDPYSLHVVRRYRLPCRRPHGLWVDGPPGLAYIACEGDARLLVLELGSGKIRAKLPTGPRPDVLAFDSSRGLLFVASESGFVSVYQKLGTNIVPVSSGSFLGFRAHSLLVDPLTHLLYLPLENDDGRPVLRILSWKS